MSCSMTAATGPLQLGRWTMTVSAGGESPTPPSRARPICDFWPMPQRRRLADNDCVDDRISVTDPLLSRIEAMQAALAQANNERRWAECSSRVQSDAMQRALDLLVREPDINGFFRLVIQSIVEECEAFACGVWLLDEAQTDGHLWMVYAGNRHVTSESEEWASLAL